jgi:hypothetical protein
MSFAATTTRHPAKKKKKQSKNEKESKKKEREGGNVSVCGLEERFDQVGGAAATNGMINKQLFEALELLLS